MDTAGPARLYCTMVGGALVLVGIFGLFYSAGFDTGTNGVAGDTDEVLGLLGVNGWHNLLHIALGLLALALASSAQAARTYCLAVGLAFVVLALWGLIDDDGIILGLLPLNDADNVLHLILGLTGLAAGAAAEPAKSGPATGKPARSRSDSAKA